MGIIGKVFARLPYLRVETMKVGQVAYLLVFDIILTDRALFVDRTSPVYLDTEKKHLGGFVQITRLTTGFEARDFVLLFPDELDEAHILTKDPESVHIYNMKERKRFIIFTVPEVVLVSEQIPVPSEKKPRTEIDILTDDMNRAAEKADFEKAAEIRDKIKRLNRGTT